MQAIALQFAGALAVIAAVAHGVLGETAVFAKASIEPPRLRRLLRLVWQCSAAAWVGLGVLLFISPSMEAPFARQWIVAVSILVFGTAAMANAWATKGRHFGWMALALICSLAAAGQYVG